MPNNESVDIFGRRRRHPEKRIDCAAKLKPKRRKRIATIVKRAKALGVAVTIGADGSMTFHTSHVEEPSPPHAGNGADLDRELEEWEARHGQA